LLAIRGTGRDIHECGGVGGTVARDQRVNSGK
jgi:hypothetical protein